MNWKDVIHFWFEECTPEQWFKKDEAFDTLVRERFLSLFLDAEAGRTSTWRETPEGRLAEILLLDQFSRNMFRDTPRAFSADEQAVARAEEAVAAGADQELSPTTRGFLYMPYMHSESKAVHEKALPLFEALGDAGMLRYEKMHKDIIDRFGRYPSRNAILGRASTEEEMEFLKDHSGF